MINGYIPAARFLPFLSWTDVAALPDKSNTVIVLPLGRSNSTARICPARWTA
jgi:creatinine amidohydrolase